MNIQSQLARLALSAWFWVLLAVFLCAALLMSNVGVPLGPNYWDLPIYLDGAQRIAQGQVPNVDFDAPVGALGYYLVYWATALIPNGHPMFIVHWSVAVITLPLMLVLVWEMQQKQRANALLLLLPFLAFQLLPFNVQPYTSFPGVDGFAFYNRQVCQLLYVMVAILLFSKSMRFRAIGVFVLITCLFYIKITGFAVAGLIAIFALVTGRLTLVHAIGSAVAFLAIAAVLEVTMGIPSAYFHDLTVLMGANQGTLLSRFVRVFSIRFDTIFATAVLVCTLWLLTCSASWKSYQTNRSVSAVLDQPVYWLALGLVVGIIFETQNTGSQDFIFLWPILLWLLHCYAGDSSPFEAGWRRWTMIALVALAAVPPFVQVTHRAARAAASNPTYDSINLPHLHALGRVNVKDAVLRRVKMMNEHYASHKPTYLDLAEKGQLPAWMYFSEIPMQGTWLRQVDRAIDALLKIEEKSGRRFDSLFSMDFTSPFAWAMDRDAPKHVQLALDPGRTMVPLTDGEREAMEGTTAILKPLCPLLSNREFIAGHFSPITKGRVAVPLHPCWTLYLEPDDAIAFGLN